MIRVWTPIAFWIRGSEATIEPEEVPSWSMPMGGPSSNPIVIWPWSCVPDALRRHVYDPNGVDWVAFVPRGYDVASIPWLQTPAFGSRRVEEYPIGGGVLRVAYRA